MQATESTSGEYSDKLTQYFFDMYKKIQDGARIVNHSPPLAPFPLQLLTTAEIVVLDISIYKMLENDGNNIDNITFYNLIALINYDYKAFYQVINADIMRTFLYLKSLDLSHKKPGKNDDNKPMTIEEIKAKVSDLPHTQPLKIASSPKKIVTAKVWQDFMYREIFQNNLLSLEREESNQDFETLQDQFDWRMIKIIDALAENIAGYIDFRLVDNSTVLSYIDFQQVDTTDAVLPDS